MVSSSSRLFNTKYEVQAKFEDSSYRLQARTPQLVLFLMSFVDTVCLLLIYIEQ